MIKIKFFKKDNVFAGYECSGHAGYGKHGQDIVCASVSTITQSVILGLERVCHVAVDVVKNDDTGYIKVNIPNTDNNLQHAQVQVLMETLYLTIKDLQEGYSKYILMEVIENVY